MAVLWKPQGYPLDSRTAGPVHLARTEDCRARASEVPLSLNFNQLTLLREKGEGPMCRFLL